jgi:threonine synthase
MVGTELVRFCRQCHQPYAFEDRSWRCQCGGVLALPPRSGFAPPTRERGIWKYAANLPLGGTRERVSLGEGGTPLLRLRALPGMVYAKLEFLAPTGSFKDRGAATAVSRFASIGIRSIVDDSAGNAGVSLAAYCAAAAIGCHIYAVASSNAERVGQVRCYNAGFTAVPGGRAAATEAAIDASARSYYAGHAWDPYFIEGIKTIAYELAEQLENDPPARIMFPLGQGTLLLGLLRGFDELLDAGRLQRKPELIAVQTDACAPIYAMARDGLAAPPALVRPQRIVADGIAVSAPVRWRELIEAARTGAVTIVSAPDEAALAAARRLGQSGLFVEPTSAIVLAAFEHLTADPAAPFDGATVLILTSSGLKAGVAAMTH